MTPSSDGKASVYNVGDPGSIPGLGRFPGEGNGNPLQYSCLGNLIDRVAWQATVHGVTKIPPVDFPGTSKILSYSLSNKLSYHHPFLSV